MPPAGVKHRPSTLGVPTALFARSTVGTIQLFRLGVVRVLLRESCYRPSVDRQIAEQDTLHDDRGLVVTALAA